MQGCTHQKNNPMTLYKLFNKELDSSDLEKDLCVNFGYLEDDLGLQKEYV